MALASRCFSEDRVRPLTVSAELAMAASVIGRALKPMAGSTQRRVSPQGGHHRGGLLLRPTGGGIRRRKRFTWLELWYVLMFSWTLVYILTLLPLFSFHSAVTTYRTSFCGNPTCLCIVDFKINLFVHYLHSLNHFYLSFRLPAVLCPKTGTERKRQSLQSARSLYAYPHLSEVKDPRNDARPVPVKRVHWWDCSIPVCWLKSRMSN